LFHQARIIALKKFGQSLFVRVIAELPSFLESIEALRPLYLARFRQGLFRRYPVVVLVRWFSGHPVFPNSGCPERAWDLNKYDTACSGRQAHSDAGPLDLNEFGRLLNSGKTEDLQKVARALAHGRTFGFEAARPAEANC
jgi:hypothetical protein